MCSNDGWRWRTIMRWRAKLNMHKCRIQIWIWFIHYEHLCQWDMRCTLSKAGRTVDYSRYAEYESLCVLEILLWADKWRHACVHTSICYIWLLWYTGRCNTFEDSPATAISTVLLSISWARKRLCKLYCCCCFAIYVDVTREQRHLMVSNIFKPSKSDMPW